MQTTTPTTREELLNALHNVYTFYRREIHKIYTESLFILFYLSQKGKGWGPANIEN